MGEKKDTKGLEKMGALEKGVKASVAESTEEIIKEIETFDATKDTREDAEVTGQKRESPGKERVEEGGKSKETGESGEAETGEKKEDIEVLKKELAREREKTKNLAKIIEKVSNSANAEKKEIDIEPKLKEIEGRINEQVQSQLKEVKEAIAAIGTKVEEVAKSGKGEKMGTKVKDMIDKVQADTSKKITELEETIKKMMEKVEEPKKEEDVSKGLSAFGGKVDLKNEIVEIKDSLKELEKSINELRDETDTRITRIKEQIKALEKLPTLEEKVEGLIERMSPGNIEKLKKFIFSADEITSEIIPNEVEKKVTKELTPVFNDIKDVRDDVEKFGENIKRIFDELNYFKGEIKTLYKFGDYISRLQSDKEKLEEKINEKEDNLLRMLNKLEELIKKRTDAVHEDVRKFEKSFTEKVEDKVKECFDDLTESKFLELEDRTEKNLAVARAKVNDMLSKFVQFQNVVNPTLSLIKEELENLNTRIEKLKDEQTETEKEIDERVKDMFSEVAEPRLKEIKDDMNKFSEATKDRLDDFESEFVQFQNVINPTLNLLRNDISKLDSKLEKLKTAQDDLKERFKEIGELRKSLDSMKEKVKSLETGKKELEKKISLLNDGLRQINGEFKDVVKQTLAERKKLEGESKKQKERINILLKELKGS